MSKRKSTKLSVALKGHPTEQYRYESPYSESHTQTILVNKIEVILELFITNDKVDLFIASPNERQLNKLLKEKLKNA